MSNESWEDYETAPSANGDGYDYDFTDSDDSTSLGDVDSDDASAIEEIYMKRYARNLDHSLQQEFEFQTQWLRQLVEGDGRYLVRPSDRAKRPSHLLMRDPLTATDEFQKRIRSQLGILAGARKRDAQSNVGSEEDAASSSSLSSASESGNNNRKKKQKQQQHQETSLRQQLTDIVVPEYCAQLLAQLLSSATTASSTSAPSDPTAAATATKKSPAKTQQEEGEVETARLFRLIEELRGRSRRETDAEEKEEEEEQHGDDDEEKMHKRRRTESGKEDGAKKGDGEPSEDNSTEEERRTQMSTRLLEIRRALRHAKKYDWYEDVVAPIAKNQRGADANVNIKQQGEGNKNGAFEPVRASPAVGEFATAMAEERQHFKKQQQEENNGDESASSQQMAKKEAEAADEKTEEREEEAVGGSSKKKSKPPKLKKKYQFNKALVSAVNKCPMRSSLNSLVLEVEGSDLAVAEAGKGVREAFRVLRDEVRQFQRLAMERRVLMLMVDVHTLLTQETFDAAERLVSEGIKACRQREQTTKKRRKRREETGE